MEESGVSPIAQLLTGGASDGSGRTPLQGPPQGNQPSGLPRPHDPAEKPLKALVGALKTLGSQISKLDDPVFGNKLNKMAVEVEKEAILRSKKLEQRVQAFQGGMSDNSY